MINVCFIDCTHMNLRNANYIPKKDNINLDLDNIFLINLQLDYGKIFDNELGKERFNLLKELQDGYLYGEDAPNTYDGGFTNSVKTVERFKESIKSGEDIRIWYSEHSCEYCNFCWLIWMLDELNVQNRIYVVKTPSEIISPRGKYDRRFCTASFHPEELAELVSTQTVMSKSRKKFYIAQWKNARRENTSLRLVLNCSIVSVNEDFYDSAILIEAEKYKGVINETQLVGRCMAKLGLSDLFIGKRIEYMITKGIFKAVTLPVISTPFYHKKIKKIQ